jgi:hypothetical protein
MATISHPAFPRHWIVDGVVVAGVDTAAAAEALLAAALAPPADDPRPTADDVRAEASRRLRRLVGARDAAHLEIILANDTREAVRLLRVAAERPWTLEEAARAANLQALDGAIEAIRAASNRMEAEPPHDYADDARWP